MKKLLTLMVATTMIFASCSKEAKLNRRLDGSWAVKTMDGAALPSGSSITIEFEKDGKEGTYTTTSVFGSITDTDTGTYALTKDEKITLTSDGDNDIILVKEYSKTEMTLTAEDGTDVMVLEKK